MCPYLLVPVSAASYASNPATILTTQDILDNTGHIVLFSLPSATPEWLGRGTHRFQNTCLLCMQPSSTSFLSQGE